MNIAFYFDPSCPFCWITSRWLLMVQAERDITIDWRVFSLAIKNDERIAKDDENEHAALHRGGHRILRVISAAQAAGANAIDLYTAFGIPHHIGGETFDDELIMKILKQQGLSTALATAADDSSYDDAIAASTISATDIAGEDIGVPTIVFTAEDGSKSGFFGPVLQQLPTKEAALKLWDGLSLVASDSNFYELKRSRPSGGPNVFSTAKC